MIVPKAVAEEMNRMCKGVESNLGDRSSLFDHEVDFPNHKVMAIMVCPCGSEPAWTQGVMFNDVEGDLFEISCTEVKGSLTGSFMIESDGDEFIVDVEAGDVEKVTIEES